MKKLERIVMLLLAAAVLFACGKENPQGETQSTFNVSGIILPDVLECQGGTTVEIRLVGSHVPLVTDKVELAGESTFVMPISAVEKNRFLFTMDKGIFSGDFVMSIIRGTQSKRVGKIRLLVSGGAPIDPGDATIYGQITAKGKGLEGVLVSDGLEVVRTDKDGIYRIKSAKKYGVVFMTIPSGYEALSNGVLPRFHKALASSKDVAERVDFQLQEAPGQDHHKMLMMGDIHLARRTQDREQFSSFVSDVNSYIASCPDKLYGLTLGDMTWDLYWIVNSYGFAEYIQDANRISGVQLFHTIGNHDHSMYYSGDIQTVKDYTSLIAPTYYSMNIGKVHYVVLDDVECTNSKKTTDGKGNPCYERSYNGNVVSDQLTWLERDLSYVDASTPVVLTMHIPLFNSNNTWRMNSTTGKKMESMLSKFSKVHIYTGHTHVIYNVDYTERDHIFEHNSGSVCGTWWWSGKETPGVHIGQDGSPGGYAILDVNGTDFSWQYKATGYPIDYQFRTYDRNSIHITADKYVPSGSATSKAALKAGRWATASTANEVYINVWNYDPSWTIEVTEGGKPLTVKSVTELDPLHLISYTAKRLNQNADASFATTSTDHLFYVTASDKSSTLEIKVTDKFGNVYRETMARPKKFDTDTYKN